MPYFCYFLKINKSIYLNKAYRLTKFTEKQQKHICCNSRHQSMLLFRFSDGVTAVTLYVLSAKPDVKIFLVRNSYFKSQTVCYCFFYKKKKKFGLGCVISLILTSLIVPSRNILQHTPPNFRVCVRQKVPAKCFKISYSFGIRKPTFFSVFHFVLLYFFPN